MPEPRRKAYSYLRFSRPEQALGASRKRQSEGAAEYARQHGLELDETLADEGVSAFKGRHRDPTSALGAFLAKVSEGKVKPGSVLIVESLDRLSREQVLTALQLLITLVNAGIEVVTLADGRSYSEESLRQDSTSLIVSIVVMTRAHEESLTKSKRVGDAWKRKKEAARERGQAMTARCPGWMSLVGGPRAGQYEFIGERHKVVAEVFEATVAGDGRRTIAKRLNERGEQPWGVGRSRGAYWHDSYIAKILASPATYGRYQSEDDADPIDGYFPKAIDENLYWRAQAATAGRKGSAGRTSVRFSNLLKGLVRCEACGGNLVYVDKGKRSRPALVCASSRSRGGCEQRRSFPYQGLEGVVALGFAHFADAALFAEDEALRAIEASTQVLEKRHKDLGMRQRNLIAAIEEAGEIPAVRNRLREIAGAIAEVEAEIRRLRLAAADRVELDEDIEARIGAIELKLYAVC